MMELFEQKLTAKSHQLFLRKVPSQMFDRVLKRVSKQSLCLRTVILKNLALARDLVRHNFNDPEVVI